MCRVRSHWTCVRDQGCPGITFSGRVFSRFRTVAPPSGPAPGSLPSTWGTTRPGRGYIRSSAGRKSRPRPNGLCGSLGKALRSNRSCPIQSVRVPNPLCSASGKYDRTLPMASFSAASVIRAGERAGRRTALLRANRSHWLPRGCSERHPNQVVEAISSITSTPWRAPSESCHSAQFARRAIQKIENPTGSGHAPGKAPVSPRR